MATDDDGVSWAEATVLVGCPVSTVEWQGRQGRIDHRTKRRRRASRSERPPTSALRATGRLHAVEPPQADPVVELTANFWDISAGIEDEPVPNSGVFVGDFGDWDGKASGGTVRVSELRTGDIHTDGGITDSTLDPISDGCS